MEIDTEITQIFPTEVLWKIFAYINHFHIYNKDMDKKRYIYYDNVSTEEKERLFILAAEHNQINIVKRLLKHHDVDSQARDNLAARKALVNGNQKIFKLLYKWVEDEVFENIEYSEIILAIVNNNPSFIKFIIDKLNRSDYHVLYIIIEKYVEYDNINMLKYIFNGDNANFDGNLAIAIYAAIKYDNLRIFKFLSKKLLLLNDTSIINGIQNKIKYSSKRSIKKYIINIGGSFLVYQKK